MEISNTSWKEIKLALFWECENDPDYGRKNLLNKISVTENHYRFSPAVGKKAGYAITAYKMYCVCADFSNDEISRRNYVEKSAYWLGQALKCESCEAFKKASFIICRKSGDADFPIYAHEFAAAGVESAEYCRDKICTMKKSAPSF